MATIHQLFHRAANEAERRLRAENSVTKVLNRLLAHEEQQIIDAMVEQFCLLYRDAREVTADRRRPPTYRDELRLAMARQVEGSGDA